jgi:hypothetical protein
MIDEILETGAACHHAQPITILERDVSFVNKSRPYHPTSPMTRSLFHRQQSRPGRLNGLWKADDRPRPEETVLLAADYRPTASHLELNEQLV